MNSAADDRSHGSSNEIRCYVLHRVTRATSCLSGHREQTVGSPFGVEQVSDLLVVNLHVGDLHGEALSLAGLRHRPAEQGAAEPGDQTGLLRRAHHGVRLPRACSSHGKTSGHKTREKQTDGPAP